jgi:hypothetical protein
VSHAYVCRHGHLERTCEMAKEIATLKRQVEELEKRDLKATIELCYNDGDDPFARERLKVIDVGVSDNIYVVESEVVAALKRQVDVLANEFSTHGRCVECQARYLCLHSAGGLTCVDAIKQWSLEQAKAGGAGANAGAVPRRGSDVGTRPLLGGNGG